MHIFRMVSNWFIAPQYSSTKDLARRQLSAAEYEILVIEGQIEELSAARDMNYARIVRLTNYLSEN